MKHYYFTQYEYRISNDMVISDSTIITSPYKIENMSELFDVLEDYCMECYDDFKFIEDIKNLNFLHTGE